ncbi:MAG: hypothetical protein CM15mP49_33630 [Actinomycetota bacterium]|nr:MAG: hypothetical protein CM15mP49_33630 [Actinomycetota bacterium]
MEETIVVSKEISAGPQEVWDLVTDLQTWVGGHLKTMGGNGSPKMGDQNSARDSWVKTVGKGTSGLPLSRLRNSLNRNDLLSK